MDWKSRRPPIYSPPGTITVDPAAPRPVIRIIAYNPDSFVDKVLESPEQITEYLQHYKIVWVNVDGLGDLDTILKIGEVFGIHKLALEDVVHLGQRPKVDDFEHSLYIVARMVDRQNGRLGTEQLNMFLGRNYVLTLQERPGDCLDALRRRAEHNRGTIRNLGPDYLAYAILDSVVDEYFPVLEQLGDQLENIEDQIILRPSPRLAQRVHEIRRDLLVLRRSMWPMREALAALHRATSPYISGESRLYFRDCYDHSVQVLDLIEVYRELSSGQIELYMTSVSNRMNEIMKVLTIIATIFIPLTFVAGVYGMNFSNMPELHWRYGYLYSLVLMGLIAAGMMVYFWRKGWLRSQDRPLPQRDSKELDR